MKKVFLFTATALTLILVSCDKENGITPNANVQSCDPTTYNYKFSREITIRDKTGSYFLTLALQSDIEANVTQACKQYENAELEILLEKPVVATPSLKMNFASTQPIFEKNSLMVKYVNSNTEKTIGYCINVKNDNKSEIGENVTISGFNLISYSGFTCTQLATYLIGGNNVACSYYQENSGSWIFEQSFTMPIGTFSYSPANYHHRLVQLYKPATFIRAKITVQN